MVGHQFFAHASNKNVRSLDVINDFLNVAKNEYSLNQAVDVGRIDRFMQIAIFG